MPHLLLYLMNFCTICAITAANASTCSFIASNSNTDLVRLQSSVTKLHCLEYVAEIHNYVPLRLVPCRVNTIVIV